MARANAFKVEGIVLEALANQTYRVRLANGHRPLAFVPGRAKANGVRFAPGDRVTLELSPYDLSEARIVVEQETT